MTNATVDIERIVVAGASGRTGRELLELLDGRGPLVRGVTRSPEKEASLRRAGADEVIVGDLLDPSDAERAIDGADAVLSALGSSVREVMRADTFVDGRGNRNLVDAAVDADVDHFVMQSALGVGDEPASALGRTFDVLVGPVQQAKATAERAVRDAPLTHTIIRPGALTIGSRTGNVQVAEPGAKLWGAVSRANVAWILAASLATPAAADRTFEVVSNPLLRDRGLDIDWTLPGD